MKENKLMAMNNKINERYTKFNKFDQEIYNN